MVIFRAKQNKLDPRYLYFFLCSKEFKEQMQSLTTGSAQPQFPIRDIVRVRMPLPPLPEQREIARILGALDDKIELNRRMNETLEAMARALFKCWFVDFEPVRIKQAARARGGDPIAALCRLPSAGGLGLDPAIAALFPDSFEDSPLGEIPKGWKVKSIDEIAERVAMGPFGSDIKVDTFVANGIPVVSGQHLRGTLLEDSEFNFVTVEHAERLKRSNVKRGDVIFTHAGSIGQVAYIPESSRYERYIISQRQFYVRCNRSLISPYYVTSYFKTPEGQHRLLANTSSTGVPSISQPVSFLRQLKLVVPSPALLEIFDTHVGRIHLRLAANLHQSRILSETRDALLPRLVSGDLSLG